MGLVIVLSLLVGKNQVQGNLVRLVNYRAVAGRHFANVEVKHSGNLPEIFVSPGDQLVGGIGIGRVSPKDNDVRKHAGGRCIELILAMVLGCASDESLIFQSYPAVPAESQ
jgi:hypothetical protein